MLLLDDAPEFQTTTSRLSNISVRNFYVKYSAIWIPGVPNILLGVKIFRRRCNRLGHLRPDAELIFLIDILDNLEVIVWNFDARTSKPWCINTSKLKCAEYFRKNKLFWLMATLRFIGLSYCWNLVAIMFKFFSVTLGPTNSGTCGFWQLYF